ncbi:MAG TPA: hypothetical protein VMB25_02910 [Bryobacteraceae bacterium]|nr:hypothetical protein [Bryobacteraceae bacterium]
MHPRSASSETGGFSIRELPCAAPAEAVLIPFSAYPAPRGELETHGDFVHRLVATLRSRWSLESEMFLYIPRLNRGGGNRTLAAHAQAWSPRQGLGVWPSREPPKLWTKEEFMALDPGQAPRPLRDTVFHITRKGAQREVADSLRGLGSLLEFLLPAGDADFFKRSKTLLQPMLKDPAFQMFKLQVPLLDAAAIAGAAFDQLSRWLCGARAYIWESEEDHGTLVLSLAPLPAILESLGARRRPEAPGEWLVPAARS